MSHIYPQDFKYGVINTVDLANVDFDETIYPTSPTSLRYSLDGSQFLIKWEEGHQPEFINNGTVVPASILPQHLHRKPIDTVYYPMVKLQALN